MNNQRRSIIVKLNQVSKLQNLNTGDHTGSIKQMQKEVDGMLVEENVKWKQRAKQTWLKDGDKNMKFYHMCANQMRKNNTIRRIDKMMALQLQNLRRLQRYSPSFMRTCFPLLSPKELMTASVL